LGFALRSGKAMGSTDFLETSVKYYCLKVQPDQVPSFNGSAGGARAHAAAASSAPSPNTDGNKFQKTQKELFEMSRRRFFYRPAFEIYGGVAGFWTYGPPGCALKNNIINQWRHHFVIEENLLEVEDTCIMQHAVLKASGHVDRFNDFMVKDVIDESKFYRADKLLEEVMEAKLEAADVTEAQRVEYTTVKNQADAFSKQELAGVFKKYQIKSPESGNDLSDPYEFNLMFPTPIGPGGYLQGYMRPETAQGIFLNYKFCLEQNSNRLPFGVAQVGKAFRNEIAPRAGLTRQREFTQAEIEYFVNPSNKAHPKFKFVEDTELTLFHHVEQLAAKEGMTLNKIMLAQMGTLCALRLEKLCGAAWSTMRPLGT
jgi:glycyl-tRNA synthetase